jgi:hypothetical protein
MPTSAVIPLHLILCTNIFNGYSESPIEVILIVDHENFFFLLQLKILTMRATNIRAPRCVRVVGIFNSI